MDLGLGHIAFELVPAGPALHGLESEDLAAARERGLSAAMLDRLMLDDARIGSMADGIEAIAFRFRTLAPAFRFPVRCRFLSVTGLPVELLPVALGAFSFSGAIAK